jgi:hypothetical protein
VACTKEVTHAMYAGVDVSSIPQHDVDASCGTIGYNVAINECIESEQAGYDYLKSVWPDVPHDMKAECVRDAGNLGYFCSGGLSGCVRGYYEPYRREHAPRESFQP